MFFTLQERQFGPFGLATSKSESVLFWSLTDETIRGQFNLNCFLFLRSCSLQKNNKKKTQLKTTSLTVHSHLSTS